MVKKLMIKESVNKMTDEVYDNIALLGYACTLAANDLHHIHLCAIGDKFQEIHESADEYLSKVRELNDFCLELAKEGGLETYNETFANDVIKDAGNDWKVAEDKEYDFVKAFTEISNILTDLSQFIMIIEELEGVTPDVTSVLDDYLRGFTKAVNYFIDKKLANDEDILTSGTVDIDVESFKRNKRRTVKESVISDRFEVRGYYDSDYRGLVDSESFDWYDEAKDYAHELLMSGKDVIIKDIKTGNEVKIACGEYNYKFDGEFCINNDIYNFEQSIQNESINRDRKRLAKESIYGKTFTGSTWKELIKNIEDNSNYQVDSAERNIVGSKHNSILLHGKKGLFLATVNKTNDGFMIREVDIKPMKESIKRAFNESYKDSKAYKKLAEYDYICEVDGNKVTIKWADDGHTYAEFTLYSPEEMFIDTDIDPYDDFGKSHGFDCWVIDDGNGLIDTYAKTYDDAVITAIDYFWNHY